MKLPALSREQVRQVDRMAIEEYGVPGIVLMENAGRGATEILIQIAARGPFVILCGAGNNGGDGYVIARHLQLREYDVRIGSLVEVEALSGDARTNAEIARKSDIDITVCRHRDDLNACLGNAGTIVDGLLGTGARGPLRGLYLDAVEAANAADATRVAIDIPTGLDCDSGEASGPCFHADHTISFVAPKIGFEENNADKFVGVVHVVEIGAPKKVLESFSHLI